ncbi:MAG: tetratricopeptide repeat protein [Verrucomicrobia bacterium]|nr:MAG: tetratricopeptide repeat protein [Verrucomicrobiota bacterium]
MAEAVREYREAVRLSPNDYRYWGELGRALEAQGDSAGAEQALRRAVELAPSYSYPRWYLGNLLLREGKQEEAFQELARAAAADGQLQSQVFNLAWQFFEGNVNEITRVACPSPAVRAEFALYLAGLKKFDEALRIWGTLSRADYRSLSSAGDRLKQTLIESKQFRVALKVLSDTEPADIALPVAEQFTNGGFENPLVHASVNSFDWSIGSGTQVQVGVDAVAHSGHNSLRIIFKVPNKLDVIPVSQTVVVEPNMRYHFECYARTEALNTGSAPVLIVSDATDNNVLVSSAPLPTGTNDWQKMSFDFTTKPRSDGVTLTLVRPPCSVGAICPILGTAWYDDFKLQRAGGSVGAR